MRKILVTATAFFFLASLAGAQTSTPSRVEEYRNGLKQVREQAQSEVKDIRTEAKQAVQNLEEGARKAIEEKRDAFQKELEVKRVEVKDKVEKAKTDLKERLSKIKDERKKQVVERIANQINELNARSMNHFSDVLDKLANVLGRISSRADKGAVRGLDVSSVRTAISASQTAISTARDAVKAQLGKTYSVLNATTTESGLKGVVGAAREALHTDLKKVEDAVKTARDAVHNAATTLAKIQGVDDKDKENNKEEGDSNSSSSSKLLKACPEAWIVNVMPGPASSSTIPREYFVYKGVRHELTEFNVGWVKAQCSVRPTEAQ